MGRERGWQRNQESRDLSDETRTWSWSTPFVVLALLLTTTGCGDDAAPSDGGVDGGGEADAGLAVTPPDIPWLEDGMPAVTFTPCPEGWREVPHDDGVTTCDPYPETGAEACDAGEAHFPGEAGCRPIGDPCPAGDFAEMLPDAGPVLYVLGSAAAGGDGSMASPYASLSEVSWSSLAAGTTVALAKGDYEGTLPLRAGVHVVGACAAETRLTGLGGGARDLVTVTTAGEPASLTNLAIVDSPEWGVFLQPGRAITLDGVLVDGVQGIGIAAFAAEIVATDLVVRGTRPRASGDLGRGIELQGGARFDGTHVIVEGNRTFGLFANNAGTEVQLSDSVVRGTNARQADGALGRGVGIEDDARLVATRVLIDDNQQIGMWISSSAAATESTLEDVIFRSTRPQTGGRVGRGFEVQLGAVVDASRIFVDDNHDVGLLVADSALVRLDHAWVRGTKSRLDDGAGGRGISVSEFGRLEATNLLVSDNVEAGVYVVGEAALSDAAILRTEGTSSGAFGRGVNLEFGGRATLTRVLVAESRDNGVFVSDPGAELVVSDVIVRDTREQRSNQSGGRGMEAARVATIRGERLSIVTAGAVGLGSFEGSSVELSDVTISDVSVSPCSTTTCMGSPLGYGLSAISGTIRLSRFAIENAETCGVFLAQLPSADLPPAVDLVSGVVRGSLIGACVQEPGYDPMRLSDEVEYRDNDNNLDATSLPVPAATASVEP